MKRKNSDTVRDLAGYEDFEQLMERGRMLHSHAVYDAFAWIMKRASRSLAMGDATETPLAAGN